MIGSILEGNHSGRDIVYVGVAVRKGLDGGDIDIDIVSGEDFFENRQGFAGVPAVIMDKGDIFSGTEGIGIVIAGRRFFAGSIDEKDIFGEFFIVFRAFGDAFIGADGIDEYELNIFEEEFFVRQDGRNSGIYGGIVFDQKIDAEKILFRHRMPS